MLVTLKAKYQNDPNKVKKCQMFQVIEIFQAREISKFFLTGLKERTVVPKLPKFEGYCSCKVIQEYSFMVRTFKSFQRLVEQCSNNLNEL